MKTTFVLMKTTFVRILCLWDRLCSRYIIVRRIVDHQSWYNWSSFLVKNFVFNQHFRSSIFAEYWWHCLSHHHVFFNDPSECHLILFFYSYQKSSTCFFCVCRPQSMCFFLLFAKHNTFWGAEFSRLAQQLTRDLQFFVFTCHPILSLGKSHFPHLLTAGMLRDWQLLTDGFLGAVIAPQINDVANFMYNRMGLFITCCGPGRQLLAATVVLKTPRKGLFLDEFLIFSVRACFGQWTASCIEPISMAYLTPSSSIKAANFMD